MSTTINVALTKGKLAVITTGNLMVESEFHVFVEHSYRCMSQLVHCSQNKRNILDKTTII